MVVEEAVVVVWVAAEVGEAEWVEAWEASPPTCPIRSMSRPGWFWLPRNPPRLRSWNQEATRLSGPRAALNAVIR